LSYEHILLKTAVAEVRLRPLIAEQPVGVELYSGGKSPDLVGASNRRTMLEWTASATGPRYVRHRTCVQAPRGVTEREPLDLLDKRNCVAANLTTEAHETRGTGVNDEIRATCIRMERTPPDECRARTSELDAVSLDDFGDRMLLTESLRIDAFSCG
jgi:hypothetical protein